MHVGAILLSTRNSDTRSITRTVRIDEDVQDAIEHIAEQQNLSVNALVNKALRKFAFWDTALEKFEAVSTPSQLLVKMMEYLSDQNAKDLARRLEMSTAEIGLSVRTTNCLEERGIFTVNDLLHRTPDDLLTISNFGEKTLEEVYKALEGIGFYRPGRDPVHVH